MTTTLRDRFILASRTQALLPALAAVGCAVCVYGRQLSVLPVMLLVVLIPWIDRRNRLPFAGERIVAVAGAALVLVLGFVTLRYGIVGKGHYHAMLTLLGLVALYAFAHYRMSRLSYAIVVATLLVVECATALPSLEGIDLSRDKLREGYDQTPESLWSFVGVFFVIFAISARNPLLFVIGLVLVLTSSKRVLLAAAALTIAASPLVFAIDGLIRRRPALLAIVAAVAFAGIYWSYPLITGALERMDIQMFGRRDVWLHVFNHAPHGLGSSEQYAIQASRGTIQVVHSEYLRLGTDWTVAGGAIFLFTFAYIAMTSYGAAGALSVIAFMMLSFSDQGFLYVSSLVLPVAIGLAAYGRAVSPLTAKPDAYGAAHLSEASAGVETARHS